MHLDRWESSPNYPCASRIGLMHTSEIGFEEHPRAGTSDDLEALFAVYHRDLGVIFTLKEFKYNWKKSCRLYNKLY